MNANKEKILVVDDERFYIDVLVELLQDEYEIVVAKNAEQALRRADDDPAPDLILLDWLMPDMNGVEVCRQLKAGAATRDIPVIFLTIKSEVDDEIRGLEAGAVDYIRKPMSPPIVRARVRSHLALRRANHSLRNQNQILEERVRERTTELERTKNVAIYCMASLAETRDNETGQHIRRTQNYVRLLAAHLQDHPRFEEQIDNQFIELLYKTAPLHDIGKVGVPDRILLKPGPLNDEEWEEMKRHTTYGLEAIERAEQELGTTSFLSMAKQIAYTHHEQWDGSGYPEGLAGDDIPLSGRLMALADVYDALISQRVYKKPFSHEEARNIIVEKRGTHFDPDVVDAFLTLEEEFLATVRLYRDQHIPAT